MHNIKLKFDFKGAVTSKAWQTINKREMRKQCKFGTVKQNCTEKEQKVWQLMLWQEEWKYRWKLIKLLNKSASNADKAWIRICLEFWNAKRILSDYILLGITTAKDIIKSTATEIGKHFDTHRSKWKYQCSNDSLYK